MFIKHGDGKIVSVLDEEELTDEQKKTVKDATKKHTWNKVTTDTSEQKKSGS